jgi:hypothetical protein
MISPLSSEYLAACFFIKLLAFAPVSSADDSNAVAALDEAHRDDPALAAPDAKQTRFLFAVSFVYRDDSERIEKSALRFREADSMFGQVERFLLRVPFEFHVENNHTYIAF